MDDEELRRALEALPPREPPVEGWARRARRTSQARRAVATAMVLLIGLGIPGAYLVTVWQSGRAPVTPDVLATPSHPPAPVPASPTTEVPVPVEVNVPRSPQDLTGIVAIHSVEGTAEVRLCAADIRYGGDGSTPTCDGPTLKGDFSWDDLDPADYTSSGFDDGTRWTGENIRVYGFYDVNDGEFGSFTLSRPVSVEDSPPAEEDIPPALCETPLRTGAGEQDQWQRGTPAYDEAIEIAKQSSEYVDSWIDKEFGSLNIEVEPDADTEVLEKAVGAVWGGPICVGTASPIPPDIEQTAREFFEKSLQNQQIAQVTTVDDPSAARIRLIAWGYDESLASWFRTLDIPDLPVPDGIELSLEFLLTPVGQEDGEAITITTR